MFFIVERDVAEANPARRDLLVAAVPVADITGQTKGIIGYTTFESYGPKSEDLMFFAKNTGSWMVDSKTSNIPR
jgi:hypothetical protein